jgi:hypothetical protein
MDQENVVFIHNGILLSHKEEKEVSFVKNLMASVSISLYGKGLISCDWLKLHCYDWLKLSCSGYTILIS